MATVISNTNVENHAVKKYNFKVLSSNTQSDSESFTEESLEDSYTKDSNPNRRQSDIDSTSISQNSKDALIESLMKKTDEMSSNFIKLQMRLEDKELEYANEIQKVKELSFEEGISKGIEKASKDIGDNRNNSISQFASSITKLENSASEFESALENIKSDLVLAALDISKEVISTEVSNNSAEIAKKLGDDLIKELQSASKITLRVNPNDHGAISEHVGKLKHIQVVSDSAVSEGGVIAISDAGNIDSQILKRFDRVKKTAISE